MTTITVSTAAELEDALRKATGGETILLEGGNYGELDIGQWQTVRADYASEVIIQSADPADPAVFERMYLRDVSNVTLDGITFDYTYEDGDPLHLRPFRGTGENITIRNSTFDGDLMSGTGTTGDGYGTGFGLSINATGLTLENNEFFNHMKALACGGDGVVIRNNEFHDIRSDGLNLVDARGVLIEGNYFHDFVRAPGSGDHADMIQLWINDPDKLSSDITIRGNLLDVGDGGATQSIFIRNQAVDTLGGGEEVYYRNLVIEENVILNSHHHGITVPEAIGVVIRNNTILQKLGDNIDDGTSAVTFPRINVSEDAQDVVIENNITTDITGVQSGWSVADNIIAQNASYLEPFFYEALFIASSLAAGALPVVRPGSDADLLGAGASSTMAAAQDLAAAAFDVYQVPGEPTARILDASAIVLAQGGDPDALRFVWTLPDGSKAEGPVIAYDFGAAGTQPVALEVTGGGMSGHAVAGVTVTSPLLAALGGGGIVADGEGLAGTSMALLSTASAFLDLGEPGAARVDESDLLRAYNAESLSMSMTLAADRPGETGEVVHLFSALRVTVKDSGHVEVEIKTDAGERIRLVTDGPVVNDGAAHDLRIDYDGASRSVEVTIDGESAGQADLAGALGSGSRRDMVFGDLWGRENFDGKLTAFELTVADPVTAPYEGSIAPEEASLYIDQPAAQPVLIAAPQPTLDPEPVDLQAPEPDARPIFDLDQAGDGITLKRDVTLLQDADGAVLDFAGSGGTARLDGMGEPQADGTMTATFTIDREGDMGDAARLLWKHMSFGVEVKGEEIRVRAATEDEGFKVYRAKADSLDEEGERQITVAIDSDLDRIQIVVDGEVVLDEIDEGLNIAHQIKDRDYDWTFGTGYGHWFEGQVTDLRIYDDALFAPEDGQVDDAMLLS